MSERIEELPAVLDLPEEEQTKEIAKYVQSKPWEHRLRLQLSGWVVCTKCHKKIKAMPGSFTKRQLLKYGKYTSSSEEWFYHLHAKTCSIPKPIEVSLADLAFRLKDEITRSKGKWIKGRLKVCTKMDWCLYDWNEKAQPIHWIIAALIAKELSK